MTDRPNIVVLFPDQLRPDFLGCYGATALATPHIDALAMGGTRYADAISPSPICVPARPSLLTGQSAIATGVIENATWLRPDRRAIGVDSWPEALARAGYGTAAIGKMHFSPWDASEGFGHRVIAEDKRHLEIEDDYAGALAQIGCRKLHGTEQKGYVATRGASVNDLPAALQPDAWTADAAARYIRTAPTDRPFALMVGFPGPHCPCDPDPAALDRIVADRLPPPIGRTAEGDSHMEEFLALYRQDWAALDYADLTDAEVRTLRLHYAALVVAIDDGVGRILAALGATGRLADSVVVFASDHGDYLVDFGLVGKTYFHEPSIRIPLVVRDFRAPPVSRVVDAQVSLLDIVPTLLGLASATVPQVLDGVPLDAPHDPDRVIVGMTKHGAMARTTRHKLVRYAHGMQALYDLAADPQEARNLIDRPALNGVRNRLDEAMAGQVIDALRTGHADKIVGDTDPPTFHRRDGPRRYPGRSDTRAIRHGRAHPTEAT